MAGIALGLTLVWLLLISIVPTLLQARRTGRRPTQVRVRDRPGSPQWWARLLGLVALVLTLLVPVGDLTGLVEPLGVLDVTPLRAAGAVLMVLGVAGTLAAQQAMGVSWRGDVDPEARAPLVTGGPFRLVRNPVLTCTEVTAVGLALLVPNLLAVGMLVAVLAAHQVQVRLVEEPYLRAVHGQAYARYAARTGRFVPWVGRLRGGG